MRSLPLLLLLLSAGLAVAAPAGKGTGKPVPKPARPGPKAAKASGKPGVPGAATPVAAPMAQASLLPAAGLPGQLLDVRAPTRGLTLDAATASFESLVTHGVMAVVLFGSILHFPFNSWCSRGWLYWPSLLAAPRPVRTLLAFYRALMPFRIVHAYGVFPPESEADWRSSVR